MSDRVTYVGSFEGTGAALDITKVGFRPRVVKVFNKDGLCTLYWNKAMPDASGYKTITAGTESFITSNGITPLAGGFRLGADTDLNVSGEVCYFEAVD